jgi:DNA-binding transcriptional regulator PaaX
MRLNDSEWKIELVNIIMTRKRSKLEVDSCLIFLDFGMLQRTQSGAETSSHTSIRNVAQHRHYHQPKSFSSAKSYTNTCSSKGSVSSCPKSASLF